MQGRARGIRDAVVLGLAWAVLWGIAGVLAGMLIDPDGSMDEMWIAIGAYPGFIAGVVFSTVLRRAEPGRSYGELPLARAARWGAAAGLLVGAFALVFSGLWPSTAVILGVAVVLGTAAAATLLPVARALHGSPPSSPRG